MFAGTKPRLGPRGLGVWGRTFSTSSLPPMTRPAHPRPGAGWASLWSGRNETQWRAPRRRLLGCLPPVLPTSHAYAMQNPEGRRMTVGKQGDLWLCTWVNGNDAVFKRGYKGSGRGAAAQGEGWLGELPHTLQSREKPCVVPLSWSSGEAGVAVGSWGPGDPPPPQLTPSHSGNTHLVAMATRLINASLIFGTTQTLDPFEGP